MDEEREVKPRAGHASLLLSSCLGIAACALAVAQPTALTYIPGSTVKVEQVIGDCDYQAQAQQIVSGQTVTCGKPTTSQTATRFNVLGNGQGGAFEDNGKMVFFFGDTISRDVNAVNYHGADPVAWSTTTDPEGGLLLNFFTNPDGSPLFVKPPGVAMGPDDIPNAGISLNGKIYFVCNVGSDTSLANPQAGDRSILVRFDEAAHTFTYLRDVDQPGGHFIGTALHAWGGFVYMYGAGPYRASDVYLSRTPISTFESGDGTEYFGGFLNGETFWTGMESGVVPVVQDNPTNGPAWPNDNPTVGNLSVVYSNDLGLWLMLFDGGRQTAKTKSIYLTYAHQPWGPWSTPQLIFNDTRDNAYGVYIHNPGIVPDPPGDGLNGPIIGALNGADPFTTAGGAFAPLAIERFLRVSGNTLKVYYNISTWNPYTVVLVRSEFTVTGCSYALNMGGMAFPSRGGSGTITVTTASGCAWVVENVPPWVSIPGTASGVGSGSVFFQVLPNIGGSLSDSFVVAGHLFNVVQDAASIPGLGAIGSLAQVASEGFWNFSLAAINLGTAPAQAHFSFTDNNGNPLVMPLTLPQFPPASGPLLAASLDQTINPNAQFLLNSTGPTTVAPLQGWGQLSANGGISGFGTFTNTAAGWNAVVPLETQNASKYILAFDNTGAITTGLAIANLAAQTVTIQVIIRDENGGQIGSRTIQLAALGHTSFMLNDSQLGFPETNGKRGTLEFDTPVGGQISVLGLRVNGKALTTLPVLSNVGTGGGSITHATYNGGFTSTFYLVNTGAFPAQFTLSFFDENGNPLSVPLQSPAAMTTPALTQTLAAGAMLVVQTQTNDALPSVLGSAQLTTTGNIGGFEIFRWNPFGQEASVPLETRTPNSFVLVFDDTSGLTTGVAVANLTGSQTNVTVNLRDDTGALFQTQTITLAGHGHTSFLLPDKYPYSARRKGMAEFVVPPGGKISAVGLRARSSDGTLTTIPVLTK